MYTIQPVVRRTELKPKTFRSEDSAFKFMLRVLNINGLEVDKIIDQNSNGQQEFVCTDNASRFFLSVA